MSLSGFFGGTKKTDKSGPTTSVPEKSHLRATGGHIDEIITTLIVSAFDSDAHVRSTIASALHDLGFRLPVLVASACIDWLAKNSKASKEHRVILLELLNTILQEKRDAITQELATDCVMMAIEEMTRDKDIVPDLQTAAANVIVSLSHQLPALIMDELIKLWEPGQLPHYFVIKTLGDVISSNAIATIPRAKEILARQIPILANIKHDNFKWVLATITWQICEGIQAYMHNIDQGSDKTITPQSFSSEIFPAFEIMFTKWSIAGERKMKLATLRASCFMNIVFTPAQYDATTPRVLPVILTTIKREKEHLSLIEGLCVLLEAGVANKSVVLDKEALTIVMTTLHPLICVQPDYTNPVTIKVFSEALRCFEAMGRGFPEAVLSFILGKLETRDIPTRLGSLGIVKHLVVSIDSCLEDKKGVLVAGIKPVAQLETNLLVKKSLVQLVFSMASHEYLELEGGDTLLEFLIRNSAYEEPATPDKNTDVAGHLELRDMCDNVIGLAINSIEPMKRILWPYIFETIVPPHFTGAAATVCKCLSFVASRKREAQDDDYYLDFDKLSNIPKPQQIIAKLLVLLNTPFRRPNLGLNILEALRHVGPLFHPTVCDMWDEKLPKLAKYLEEKSKSQPDFDTAAWEELILRLVGEIIRIANDDDWSMVYGEALVNHVDQFKSDPYLRKVSLKHLGVTLQKLTQKEFIKAKLEAMFQNTNHGNELEREGCALGFGFCATSHLDLVLEKITEHVQQHLVPVRSSGGLFSSFSSKSSSPAVQGPPKDPVGVKNTLMLAYGYTATYGATSLITSRVEVQILNTVKSYITSVKVPVCREAVCKALTLIGKAMHPAHLQQPFVFKARDELLKIVLDFMAARDTETSNAVRVAALEAMAAFILLEPRLSDDVEKQVIISATKVIGLPAPLPAEEKLFTQMWDQLHAVLGALLAMQTSVAELCRLLQSLEQWCTAAVDIQRERACDCVLYLLKKFIQINTADPSKRVDAAFSQVGIAVSMLIPRCTDSISKVRRTAIESIGMMLYTDFLLKNAKGATGTIPPPPPLKSLNSIRDKIEKPNIDDQFAAVNDLSKAICEMLSELEYPECLLSMLNGLLDSQPTSGNGTCVALNGIIKIRGHELLPRIPDVVEGLLRAMEGITNEKTMAGALMAMRNIAVHHLIPVLKQLLEQPIPFTESVCKSFQSVSQDQLFVQCLQHITNIMNNTRLHDEKPDRRHVVNIPLTLPMSATAALGQIFKASDIEESIGQHYPLIIGTLLLRVGTCSNTEPKPIPQTSTKDPKAVKTVTVAPVKQITEAIKIFVAFPTEGDLKTAFDATGFQEKLESSKYPEAIRELVSAICTAHPDKMTGLFDFLLPYIRGNYPEQRTVTAVVLAECVNNCKDKPDLLQSIINCLIGSMSDINVKIHVLRGLGNINATGPVEANKYASTILDALTSCIEDPNEEFVMESMLGLSKVLEVVDETKVAPILVNLCHRIRPAFEKPNNEIRAVSIEMLGNLARFGKAPICADRFYEQVHLNIPSLLVHLNDENSLVVQACKKTFTKLKELLHTPELVSFIDKKAFDPEATMNYDATMEELVPLIIVAYPERIHSYLMAFLEFYKSPSNVIKANATFLTGVFLGNIPTDKRAAANINPPLVIHDLLALLKDRSPQVRDRAVDALRLLHTY
ncbi:hypothetical protein Pelo_10162 [Pelomyxa schiedti]|nr:hypothetical protein Pelo_10162 [Pelomyxa schiedti]